MSRLGMFNPYVSATLALLYLVVQLAPAIAAFLFWRRSGHTGFAWIAAGYGAYVLYPNLISILFARFVSTPSSMVFFQALFWFQIFLPLLMIVGLRSLCVSLSANSQPQSNLLEPEMKPPINWPLIKKKSVGGIGVGLTLAGIATVVRGINYIQQYNGELADLGVGPGAIVVGLMCIGLAIHPRSPLNGPNAGV